MKHSSIPSAQTLVLHCKAKGIKNIVISPGSRNAPLIIGFSEDPYFTCYSIVDERSAGFFALGIAQQLKMPIAIVCTSGSALLNYYPAVAEAFYSNIPLLVISADRPTYKVDIGDGQTIRQDSVFERQIGYSANLKQDISHSLPKVKKYAERMISEDTPEAAQQKIQAYNDRELNHSLNLALKESVPVHINIPFEEPLYGKQDMVSVDPSFSWNESDDFGTDLQLTDFLEIWNSSPKKMVLVGVSFPESLEQAVLDRLAEDPSVVVLTETTSNLHHPDFFPSIDSIIAPLEKSKGSDKLFDRLKPDILLTFGGLIVSKKIKAFLREHKPKHHWHIGPKRALDTFFCLSHHFRGDANVFLKTFLTDSKPVNSDYFLDWNSFKDNYVSMRKVYIEQVPFSDFWAYRQILGTIPENYQVQLANSSSIRYTQLFDLKNTLKIFCNRGTSGIDGSTSTAIGASLFGKDPTILITGDLSFLYDGNALWNKYIRADFRIIVVNNQGGGIFRILPGHEENANFEDYFETIHNLTAKDLCRMHGVGYKSVSDKESLQQVLRTFFRKTKRAQLLEIQTPRVLNNKILMGYFDFISSKTIKH